MSDNPLNSSANQSIRTVLRIGGPVLLVIGLIFTAIGIGSFFAAFGGFEPPPYFWCAFVGMPLMALGAGMCKLGYLGTIVRYIAGETAPVAKDTANYLGEGIQPGVKAVSKAAAEGIMEARAENRPK